MGKKVKGANDFDPKVEMAKVRLASWLAFFGCALLVAGLALPPLGVIDNSVLVAAGQVFVFSASILGIRLAYQFKVKELQQKFEHESDDPKEEDPGNS